MSTAGRYYLSALIAAGSVAEYLGHGKTAHLFTGTEQAAAEFVRFHVLKHGALPSAATVVAHTGVELGGHKEPASYYLDLMGQRHVELTCRKAMQEAAKKLSLDGKDPEACLKILAEAVMTLGMQRGGNQIHDFRDAYEIIMPEYAKPYTADGSGRLMLGWPTVDEMSGGFGRGDLVSIVGRPKLGKTFQMLYAAHHGWAAAQDKYAATGDKDVLANSSRLFVSMEMTALQIEQRLSAMHVKVPLTQLKKSELSTTGLKKLKSGLQGLKDFGAGFWVLDGNLASTVADVVMYARQLKPGAVFIDGGYLMQHPTERDRFRRVAENATLIKSELCPLAPTCVSWQFAKSGSKSQKKKGDKVTYDDIGYTDAIAQLSSFVMGVFEDESIETVVRRVMEILAGRNGEVGRFVTNWDFSAKMDFSEWTETPLGELTFV